MRRRQKRARLTQAAAWALYRIAGAGGLLVTHDHLGTSYTLRNGDGGIPEKIAKELIAAGALIAVDCGLFSDAPQSFRVRVPGDGR